MAQPTFEQLEIKQKHFEATLSNAEKFDTLIWQLFAKGKIDESERNELEIMFEEEQSASWREGYAEGVTENEDEDED
jgi:hypothetical protein